MLFFYIFLTYFLKLSTYHIYSMDEFVQISYQRFVRISWIKWFKDKLILNSHLSPPSGETMQSTQTLLKRQLLSKEALLYFEHEHRH